jgi:hypothetical protein
MPRKKDRKNNRKALNLFCRSFLLFIVFVLFLAGTGQAQVGPAYRLIGIVKGSDFIGAVIDDGKGGQAFYRLREQLPDGSRISGVQNDSVTIKQSDGASYDLFIMQSAKPSSAKPQPPGPQVNAGQAQPPEFLADQSPAAVRAQEPVQDNQPTKRGRRRLRSRE